MSKTLKELAREAKTRLKRGFWTDCRENYRQGIEQAKESGIGEVRAGRYLTQKIASSLRGEEEDAFYLRVKELLEREGEVSDAIGRLTDKAYYETLSYEEKQRYLLSLSERYLKALERFRTESEFSSLKTIEK